MIDNKEIVEIEKEAVAACHFPVHEVLNSENDKRTRAEILKKGESLGNLEHHKIKILFEDDEGLKMVFTTIWAVGDSNIVLKKGVHIPIHRIHEIKIF